MKTFLAVFILLLALELSSMGNAYLGVYLQDIAAEEKRALKITEGVRIEDTVSKSPAEDAGLKANDIILRINNRSVYDSNDVRDIIKQYNPGNTVTITYLSGGNRNHTATALAERQDSMFPGINILETRTKHLGLKVQNLTDQLREFFNVEQGVLVAEVIEGTPAKKSGIKAGDIILQCENRKIGSVAELQDVIKEKSSGDVVKLQINRAGAELDMHVEVKETDNLLSFDLNGDIIILGKNEMVDLGELSHLFQSVMPDSTKKELQDRLQSLQEELNQLRKRLQLR